MRVPRRLRRAAGASGSTSSLVRAARRRRRRGDEVASGVARGARAGGALAAGDGLPARRDRGHCALDEASDAIARRRGAGGARSRRRARPRSASSRAPGSCARPGRAARARHRRHARDASSRSTGDPGRRGDPVGRPRPRSTRSVTRTPFARPGAAAGIRLAAPRSWASPLPASEDISPSDAEAFRATSARDDLTIGCAGFPVPATRYFKEFLFVEVQETHVTQPGTGTIRRWRREAPPGSSSRCSPRARSARRGSARGRSPRRRSRASSRSARSSQAKTAVFVAPPEFTASRAQQGGGEGVSCRREEAVRARRLGASAGVGPGRGRGARDRTRASGGARSAPHGTVEGRASPTTASPGPRGTRAATRTRRSRSSPAIARGAKNKDATYVFTNVDMFADAKRFKKAVKG